MKRKTIYLLQCIVVILLLACSEDDLQSLQAAFESDLQEVTIGESITFKDISTGEPSKWNWRFEGGEPETSILFSPNVVYNKPGVYSVTLSVGRGEEANEMVKEQYITVNYPSQITVGCIFCESGRNGFVRNLTPSEIVQQVVLIRQKVNRIVFMGMGEPLFNYDNLIAAIHILRDRNGLNFPTDGITVSTVGPVNQLKKLREEHLKIQLTISLHAATQAARNCIIPHMHMYAIEDVVKQALSYSQRHNRKVVFAYLLLPGINDRSSDIRQLAKWFKGKNVMINVLQYNPTSNSKIRAPQKQEMVAFKHQLEQTGLEVTMRVSHGREIKAACGQLANTYNKAKKQQK